jgi:hypothetical protein
MREIEIQTFNEDSYLLDEQIMFNLGLKPTDLSWNYGFGSTKLKTSRYDLISEDKQNYIIVDNDILWLESISNFSKGEFSYIKTDKLYSLKSVFLKKEILKKEFNYDIPIHQSFLSVIRNQKNRINII